MEFLTLIGWGCSHYIYINMNTYLAYIYMGCFFLSIMSGMLDRKWKDFSTMVMLIVSNFVQTVINYFAFKFLGLDLISSKIGIFIILLAQYGSLKSLLLDDDTFIKGKDILEKFEKVLSAEVAYGVVVAIIVGISKSIAHFWEW